MKIGISGKMGSGKDTVADYLVEKYGFRKIPFAEELKRLSKDYFGLTKDMPKGRETLQELGKLGRFVDENFWVDKALAKIKEGENIVISDVRFKNEVKKLEENNFSVIRIDVPDEDRKKRIEVINPDDVSETELDDYNFNNIIKNDKDVEALHERIDLFMSFTKV